MQPFTTMTGLVAPLDRVNVDTDQIIPKQFLKRIERTGFGPFLFDEWRKDPDFVLNDPRYAGASIACSPRRASSGATRGARCAWA